MVAIVRHTTVTNKTNAALTSAWVNDGTDYAFKTIERILVNADIGTGIGQLSHANGCLVAQFSGCRIEDVINISAFHVDNEWSIDVTNLVSWRIEGLHSYSLYMKAPVNVLVGGDNLRALVLTGNR